MSIVRCGSSCNCSWLCCRFVACTSFVHPVIPCRLVCDTRASPHTTRICRCPPFNYHMLRIAFWKTRHWQAGEYIRRHPLGNPSNANSPQRYTMPKDGALYTAASAGAIWTVGLLSKLFLCGAARTSVTGLPAFLSLLESRGRSRSAGDPDRRGLLTGA